MNIVPRRTLGELVVEDPLLVLASFKLTRQFSSSGLDRDADVIGQVILVRLSFLVPAYPAY